MGPARALHGRARALLHPSPAVLAVVRHRITWVWGATFSLLFLGAAVMRRTAIPDLPLTATGVLCGLEIALIVPYRRWYRTGRALGAMLLVQCLIDVAAGTTFLVLAPTVPRVLSVIFIMAIVPAALASPTFGAILFASAGAAHLGLIAFAPHPVTPADVIVPLVTYTVVLFQCVRYGRILAGSAERARDESHVSSTLVHVAGALAAVSTTACVLERLVELSLQHTGATYAAVLVPDGDGGHRIGAVAARAPVGEELRTLELTDEDIGLAGIVAAPDGCLDATSPAAAGFAPWLAASWWRGPLLMAAIRGAAPAGLLVVGYDAPRAALPPLVRRLVVGLAHAGLLALENARLVDDLRAASATKSEFIGTISHEFRSPLHAIIGYTDILREDPDATPADRRAMLDRVHAHSLTLLDTIEATLTVSRLEAGRLPVRTAPVGLAELFATLRDELPESWLRDGVALCWDVPSGLPVVETDAAKLKIVVRNLLHNALKFTDAGHVRLAVAVDAEPRDALRVTVEDTGIGIPPELLSVVFEMFRQADGSDTRRHGGVGLGLYIVKRFVEAENGTIAVDSTPGAGTRMTVTVPVRVVEPSLALSA